MKFNEMKKKVINEKLSGENLKEEILRINRIAQQKDAKLDRIKMLLLTLSKNI